MLVIAKGNESMMHSSGLELSINELPDLEKFVCTYLPLGMYPRLRTILVRRRPALHSCIDFLQKHIKHNNN